MGDKKGIGMGTAAAAVALTAVAGAAGAILANKKLRNALGKKTTEALKVVSDLALRAEEEASEGLKVLHEQTKKLASAGNSKPKKSKPKK